MAAILNPTFPVPDRTKQPVNRTKDADGVIDVGWCEGVLSDGRPFRAEIWAQGGISMLTFFFSARGIEGLSADALVERLVAENLLGFRAGARRSTTVRPFNDGAADLWSVNVVVGDEDGTFLAVSPPVFAYSADGRADSVFRPRRG